MSGTSEQNRTGQPPTSSGGQQSSAGGQQTPGRAGSGQTQSQPSNQGGASGQNPPESDDLLNGQAGGGQGGGDSGNWLDGVPAELVNDKVKQFKGLPDLLKSFNAAQELIGKKGIQKPDENASADVWDAYWKALGRPDKPNDYKYEVPSGQQIPEEGLNSARQEFHKLGLTGEQFKGVIDHYVSVCKAEMDQFQQMQVQVKTETLDKLKKEFGGHLDGELAKANKVIAKYGLADAFKATGLANDYQVARAMIDFANALSEDSVLGQATGSGIDEEIRRLKQTDAYKDERHPDHAAAIQKKIELVKLKHRALGADV